MGGGGGILSPILNPVTDVLFGEVKTPKTPSPAEMAAAMKAGQGALQQSAPEKDVKVVVGSSAAKRRASTGGGTVPTVSSGLSL